MSERQIEFDIGNGKGILVTVSTEFQLVKFETTHETITIPLYDFDKIQKWIKEVTTRG